MLSQCMKLAFVLITFFATSAFFIGCQPQCTLITAVVSEHGAIAPPSGPQDTNAVVTLTATPDTGYRVKTWAGTDNDASASTENQVTMTSDKAVIVEFELIPLTLTYSADANGTISGATPQTVLYGGSGAAVSAAPAAGYHFVSWTDGGTENPRTDTNVTGNVSVTAGFSIDTFTLEYIAGPNGTTAGPSPQTVNYGGSGAAVTAIPAAQYHFVSWSDGSTQNPRTDTNVTANIGVTASFAVPPPPVVTSLKINNDSGDGTTVDLTVTLNNTATGNVADCMASESPGFTGASWAPYATAPPFSLSPGVGKRTVYFKARGEGGESNVVSDTILLAPRMAPVASGTFTMGRTSSGDDAAYGGANELPAHSVTLSAYQIGMCDVTNKEYCDVLNWAKGQGYVKDSEGSTWGGSGDLYAGGNLELIMSLSAPECNIQYTGGTSGRFSPKTRVGLPGTPPATNYAMDPHPVVEVSWFGAVAFCNWLSEMQGLMPLYDTTREYWPMAAAQASTEAYRLPTEAEWERAAAWDAAASGGPKHWVYGFMSDTLLGENRCNYDDANSTYINPLGLTEFAYTSPVGWFDGVDVSPNFHVSTVDSASPVGCYDMSGNVWQWVQDWYGAYSSNAQTDPAGPNSGAHRVYRGGCWYDQFYYCRSAFRGSLAPTSTAALLGFRLAKSN